MQTNWSQFFVNCIINAELKLRINDVEIERLHETKFMGVMLDHNLCWKMHFIYVKSKTSKSISIPYKTKALGQMKTCIDCCYTCP